VAHTNAFADTIAASTVMGLALKARKIPIWAIDPLFVNSQLTLRERVLSTRRAIRDEPSRRENQKTPKGRAQGAPPFDRRSPHEHFCLYGGFVR
jgi:hypothetical protein